MHELADRAETGTSDHSSARAGGAGRTRFGPLAIATIALLALFGCDMAGDFGDTAGAGLLEPAVEDVYRVGAVEGDRWDSFSRIASVTFDDEGRLHVLDAEEHRITVVAPDGSMVRQYGVQGDGPGEFRRPQAIAVLPSGEVAVADAGHRGFLLFSPEGEYLRALPLAEGQMGASMTFAHGDDGLVFASRSVMIRATGSGPPTIPSEIPIHRVSVTAGSDGGGEAAGREGAAGGTDARGARTEVLHRAWRPGRELSGGGGLPMGGQRAFEPRFHMAVLPDGRIAVADTSTYRIRMLAADGAEVGTVGRDIEPRPVGEEEQERERDRRLLDLEEGRGPQISIVTTDGAGGTRTAGTDELREILEEQIREMDFWPEIPVIRRLAADRDGRLWVSRTEGIGEAGPVDLLSPDGEHLGTIPTGAMAVPDAFGPDGLAAWIEPDELEIPHVRVGRLRDLP